MTRIEEIKKAFHEWEKNDKCCLNFSEASFVKGVEWADSNPRFILKKGEKAFWQYYAEKENDLKKQSEVDMLLDLAFFTYYHEQTNFVAYHSFNEVEQNQMIYLANKMIEYVKQYRVKGDTK